VSPEALNGKALIDGAAFFCNMCRGSGGMAESAKAGRGRRRWFSVASAFMLAVAAGVLLAQPGGGELEERHLKVRNVVVMREIKFASDWNADPTAVPQFFFQLRQRTGNHRRWRSYGEPLELDDEKIFRWPLIYMTGHDGFELTPRERENIRRYVLNGGVLWADDCLPNVSAFMKDFRSEMKKIFPEGQIESIKKGDPRFESAYRLFYDVKLEPGCIWNDPIDNLVMLLEGRLAILITMNDYGCGWEVSTPPTQDEPIGMGMHAWSIPQREVVYRFSTNLLFYVLTH